MTEVNVPSSNDHRRHASANKSNGSDLVTLRHEPNDDNHEELIECKMKCCDLKYQSYVHRNKTHCVSQLLQGFHRNKSRAPPNGTHHLAPARDVAELSEAPAGA